MTHSESNQSASGIELPVDAIKPEIELLGEGETWLAVSKPAGITFHSEHNAEGLVSSVRSQFGQLFPVHRLDKVTSGVLLFAKNEEANRALSLLFRERQIEKYYLALSDRKPKKKQGWIKGDMAKSRNGSYKLLRSSDNPALTRFAACAIEQGGEHRWLFLLHPFTGKTHQLRVAMKSLGAPIMGDKRYGGSHAERCYLHAWKLNFSLNGELVAIESPINWGAPIQRVLPDLMCKLSGRR